MWRVALHKLGFALVSLIIPILLSGLAVIAGRILLPLIGFYVDFSIPMESVNGQRWFIEVAIIASMVACSLIIWAAACGINRRDEVSAGAVALVVMVIWWLVLLLLWSVLLKGSTEEDTV